MVSAYHNAYILFSLLKPRMILEMANAIRIALNDTRILQTVSSKLRRPINLEAAVLHLDLAFFKDARVFQREIGKFSRFSPDSSV